ncbi:MAG: DNA polymerase III subunit delta [Patescibacteria group bacterium]
MIIFLHGSDTFRSRRFLRELQAKFTRDVDPGASSLSVVDGATASLKEISEKLNTGSLFVRKRLVVIEDIFKNKKDQIFTTLTDYLKRLEHRDDDVIIFRDTELDAKNNKLKVEAKKLFAYLAKQPYSQEFKPLSDSQLSTFIKKEANSYQKEIGVSAASLLINLSGGDLWIIASSLKKLAFAVSTKTIATSDVKEMVSGSYDEDIFGLTDALSAKDKKTAISLLHRQYSAGLSDEYLITMLIRQFKILLQLRSALDDKANPADLASQLRLHPFVVKKGLAQARNFSITALKNYLNRLVRLDFLNKTGRGDIKTELTLLISGL